jgi:hypothetical protein
MLFVTAPAGRSHRRAFIVGACVGSLLTACTNTTDPGSRQAITELTGPATINVVRGFPTKALIAIKRSSTFAGDVQLAAQGLPAGLLVSFAPSVLGSTAAFSEMTVSALFSMPPGNYSFAVRASGEGVDSRTITLPVMVTVPAITVAASSGNATVVQGSTHAVPISITREGGFTGIVGLAVLGLPAGVTATFSPPALASDATTSTLTLSAPLTAQTGVTNVTLRASAQGLADMTVPLQVTVAPATTPAILVSAAPPFLQVDGGQSVETVLSLQRFAGFDGAVSVSVDGLPANLTMAATPFAAGSNTTILQISANEQEFGGTYQLTVRASGTGIQEASTGLAVQTRPMPTFSLVFEPATGPTTSTALTINRGGSATLPRLRIVRVSAYDLPVALSIMDVPAGVTTNLPTTIPSSTTSQAFFIEINVASDAVPGEYTLTVRGQTTTPFIREVSIVLTVN